MFCLIHREQGQNPRTEPAKLARDYFPPQDGTNEET
jgi:hypothetical protein